MIDVPETPDPQGERDRMAMDPSADDEHPAWCSSQHCFVTDEGVRVHQQAPTRWEARCVVPLRFEICLIEPEDDDTTYLKLGLRGLTSQNQFSSLMRVDIARRLRDQLTEHLDTLP